MTFGVRFLGRLYAALLRLYPRGFYDEFGAEMAATFAEAAASAAARGWPALLGFLLRELRDLPRALLRANWHALREEAMMSERVTNVVVTPGNPSSREDRYAPAPWPEALLAGLPHVLVALTIQAVAVASAFGLIPSITEGGQAIQVIGGSLFALSLVVAMVFAWRQGWPRWSASWFGYAFFLLVGLSLAALKASESTLGDWMANSLGIAFFSLPVPLLLAIILCALALRNRLRFLLALLPVPVLLWMQALEFSWYPLRTVVVLVAWLGAAGVAILIARAGRVRQGVWMVLAFNLVVGLAYTYTRTYHAHFPPGAPAHYSLPPTFLDWLNRFIPWVLVTSVFILEPLLVQRLRKLGRGAGPPGAMGFRLSLVGLILLLAASLAASWWFSSGWGVINRVWGDEVGKRLWLRVLAYVGMLLCFSGAVSFGAALLRTRPSIDVAVSLFLVFVLVVMPFLLALPITYDLWDVRTIPRIWGYVAGLSWLMLGVWLISRQRTGHVSGMAS